MTLRKRLMLGLLLALAVFAAVAIFTVVSQGSQLMSQIDDQLMSTPLPPARAGGEPNQGQQNPNDPPISDLYVANVNADGEAAIVIRGQRLTDLPELKSLIASPPSEPTLITVEGVEGRSSFRVWYTPSDINRPITIVALPLDDVEATVNQMIVTFIVGSGLIFAVVALVGSWVGRYGLRPIGEMTDTADAIAAGDHDLRANSYGETTEAGRLAAALNLMLDQRDETEGRLRRFVSDASHELRTPLTSIRGYLDLYADGGFREPGQLDDAVRRMRVESSRMNLLVEDLLLLAKLDEHQPLELSTVNITTILGDIAASAHAAHPDRIIEVKTSSDTPLVTNADPLRLHQAVAGLVDNAITHAGPDANVTISANISGALLTIVVADDGKGLSTEEAANVFDRFYRGDPSRARNSGGSGLGLSIAKSIVEAHDGHITLMSSPGQGASFTVELPI